MDSFYTQYPSSYFNNEDPAFLIALFESLADVLALEKVKRQSIYDSSSSSETFIAYHGTSTSNAYSIVRSGFGVSEGQLGFGVYFAKEGKAERFAKDAYTRGKGKGSVVLECELTVSRMKKVDQASSAGSWADEGYDCVYCEKTSMSHNPEWCVSNPSNIKIISWRDVESDQWSSVYI